MRERSFSIGALSEVGDVKENNQDSILVKVGEQAGEEFGLFVVADGMGGLARGAAASAMAVNRFAQWWDNSLSSMLQKDGDIDADTVDRELSGIVQLVNRDILQYGHAIGDKAGTTVTALFAYKGRYMVKHVGDSRLYIIGKDITRVTRDHSWVAQQVELGLMSGEEARNHPKRNVLTRCIGVFEELEIFETSGHICGGDAFLLCSDGFYNNLEEQEIYEAVSRSLGGEDMSLQEVLEELFRKVRERGAFDNVSAVVAFQGSAGGKKGLWNRLKGMFVL